MDHAEVLDRLEDAFLGPGKLAAIEADRSAQGVELRAHLDGCDACSLEYQAWRTAAAALDAATPESLRAPAGSRQRIMAAVAAIGAPRAVGGEAEAGSLVDGASSVSRRPGVPRASWLAAAAAAGAVIFLIGAFLGGPLGLTSAPTPPSNAPPVPAAVAVAMDRVLQEPGHREITLVGPTGEPGGTLLIGASGGQIVVVSTALAAVPEGARYDCFLERDGARTPVGWMRWTDELAFWVGAMEEPPDAGRVGDRFVIVLDTGSGTPALSGQF